MYVHTTQMEPLFPAKTGELEDLAREIVAASAKLEGRLSPIVLSEIRELLRVVNSYYSNLIEGHSTHPVDIERAMRSSYSSDQDKRDLQIESRVHIEVQKKIAAQVRAVKSTATDSVSTLTTSSPSSSTAGVGVAAGGFAVWVCCALVNSSPNTPNPAKASTTNKK